jgi:hypothetical protein
MLTKPAIPMAIILGALTSPALFSRGDVETARSERDCRSRMTPTARVHNAGLRHSAL